MEPFVSELRSTATVQDGHAQWLKVGKSDGEGTNL